MYGVYRGSVMIEMMVHDGKGIHVMDCNGIMIEPWSLSDVSINSLLIGSRLLVDIMLVMMAAADDQGYALSGFTSSDENHQLCHITTKYEQMLGPNEPSSSFIVLQFSVPAGNTAGFVPNHQPLI